MPKVTKRNGTSEEFIPEKVVVACLKCGAPAETAREIARDVQNKVKDRTSTAEIRSIVLEQLRTKNPQWEQDWRLYDRAVKRRAQ